MTNEMKIASIYVNFSGDTTPTVEEMYPYLELAENFGSAAATAKIIEDGTLGDLLFGNALSNADKVTTVFQALFGREPLQAGLDYWVDQLENNSQYVNETTMAQAILRGAEANADQTDWNAIVAESGSLATDLENYTSEEPTVPGESFTLTEGRDLINGTENDDTIYGDVGQNDLGAQSNALDSGDVVNGGAGNDTLYATMMNSNEVDGANANQAPMPRINDVEEIRLEAMESVVFDANHVNNEDHYASQDSRDDLVITNVDISSTQITNDIVLEMKDTQQFSDMEVYFNESDLKAAPDETVGSAQVIIQVADGAQTDASNPIGNMTFDLTFTQGEDTYAFENLESTDGTYAGLVTAIQVALAAEGLTKYSVELAGEFTSFTTASNKSVDLDYTGNYITITDDEGEEFTDINFAPEQKAGSPVAILLAQSEVNADEVTTTYMVESTVIFDNVGRGSNGGEFIVGSTSNSNSSTGVERINVIVENSSVVSDISSTNDTLEHITLTNGEVKGDFVLANADFDATDADNQYGNVDQAQLVKEGLTSITATDFDGDIVLGRDANIVDLTTLSASVNGDVTYNATLNDNDNYTAVTGNGADTINITLDDNFIEADTEYDTAVTINSGASNDVITVDEDNTSLENTSATIDAGAGDDVVNGNDVAVTVEAGSGNDVVYAENTGVKALLGVDLTSVYTAGTPATHNAAANLVGAEIHFLAGREVQVTIATDGAAGNNLVNGFESVIGSATIEASNGSALTTLADLNAAVVKAINENDVLNKIATAYIDENNQVAVQYLVDGVQNVAAVEVEVTNPAVATSISTAMLNEVRDFYNDSTITSATVLGLYNADLSSTTASDATHEGSTIVTVAGTVDETLTITIGEDVITVDILAADTAITTSAKIADALIAKGYYAQTDGVDTVSVITDQETLANGTGDAALTVNNDVVLDETAIANLVGTDSVDADNANTINGGSGDDVIVLSSDDTLADTVVWTNYNQGDDTIVHFVSTTDKLDFTSYLTGTVDGNNNGSTSDESEVSLPNTAAANDTFTANSINLIQFNALDAVTATQTFESLTAAQLEAALEADASANIVASTNGIYQANATSVLIIEDAANANGAVLGDTDNSGTYKAFEVTYNDTTAAAGTTDFTVKLIGSFDLGADNLVTGDLVL